ncbi:uncharacterized protein BCR38DRAFT_413023 [Pseudomassariella vexata]|uniref:N-acetyltransferase domain-containing protein n=1 Tax=Pseudomassariella vexata TaxID=1141098 RepID=A0A1Y2DHH9_9PEZI|nr:uncharacterized protein BCR38DRAFT_413023 [Pseudomassariella vexata]ORY58700.1 hypothetical protein BCR38DRAFT_413023 [Pseudomassariella vexata]
MALPLSNNGSPDSVLTSQNWTVDVAGQKVALPIVAIKPDLGISLMMVIDLGVEFGAHCGREIANKVTSVEPEVIVGAATMGIPVAIEVSRALGLDRFVILQKSPKIHLADALVQNVTSITSMGEQKLLLDRRAVPLLAGKRVVVVDDVVATGSSLKGSIELVRRAGGNIVGAAVILTEAREWEATLGQDASLVQSLAHMPQFAFDGKEWKPIPELIILTSLPCKGSLIVKMPAIMDDPSSPTIYRVVGAPPFPEPNNPAVPSNVLPRQVTLRDRQTVATVVPFASRDQVPASLLKYLSDQFAKEIEGGDTYPMIEPMPLEQYSKYWFQNFAAIMLLGDINSPDEVVEGKDWSKECLGSFYIKPNYPGRSSHVCNAGFLVTDASRNRGVGRLMGEAYLDWAPKLGYTYSVFNLVYETNVASCRIWDALGFKRIGRVKGCGNLKSYPDRLVDAIIYGRDLGAAEGADGPVSEERFDKIKFYLKYGRYPNGSDRAEKSRLRSAATHYKLLDNDVLMLKDKEVISDPDRQMDIARRLHEGGSHSGINKTTAMIAERYHWSRIKETVSDVIRLCGECKELGKMPVQNAAASRRGVVGGSNFSRTSASPAPGTLPAETNPASASVESANRILSLHPHHGMAPLSAASSAYANPSDISSLLNPPHGLSTSVDTGLKRHNPMLQDQSQGQIDQTHQLHHGNSSPLSALHDDNSLSFHPIDPQIISQPSHQQGHHSFHNFHPHNVPHSSPHPSHTSLSEHEPYEAHIRSHHPHTEHPDSFQALLHDPVNEVHHHHHHSGSIQEHDESSDQDQDAVDRDMDMLIEQGDDSDMEDVATLGHVGGEEGDEGKDGLGGTDGNEDDVQAREEEYGRPVRRRNWDNVVFDSPD